MEYGSPDEVLNQMGIYPLPGAMTFDHRKAFAKMATQIGLSDDLLEGVLERLNTIEVVEDEAAIRQHHIDNDELAGIF